MSAASTIEKYASHSDPVNSLTRFVAPLDINDQVAAMDVRGCAIEGLCDLIKDAPERAQTLLRVLLSGTEFLPPEVRRLRTAIDAIEPGRGNGANAILCWQLRLIARGLVKPAPQSFP